MTDLLVVCDEVYYNKYAKPLLLSLETHSPTTFENTLVYTVNFTLGNDEYAYATTYTGKEFKAYCANIRFDAIRRSLDGTNNNVLYIDVDCIIRDDLAPMLNSMTRHDFAIYEDPENTANMPYKSSLMFFKNNEKVKTFVEKCAKNVKLKHWFSDQQVVKKYINSFDLDIHLVDSIYSDWYFKDNGVIWMGKGQRKKCDKTYVNEYNKYVKDD